MDCTGGIEGGETYQGSGYLFFRDGYDRSTSRAVYRACRALAYCRFVSTQVFTGAVPFDGGSAMSVMLAIAQGKRPPRPTHPSFTADLWSLMRACWDDDPHSRPTISKVVTELLTLTIRNRLIGRAPKTHKRISPIAPVFLDNHQVDAVKRLSEEDAQTLIDVADEVSPRAILCSKDRSIDFDPNILISSIRCWMTTAFPQRSAGSACVTSTGFVAAEPCSRNHWESRFVTTQRKTRCAMMSLGTCGRVGMMVGRLRQRF